MRRRARGADDKPGGRWHALPTLRPGGHARLRDVPGVETVVADTGSSVVRMAGTMTVDDVLAAFRGLTYPVELLGEAGHAADS